MHLTTHLSFRGQCAEAFEFYERLLGGTLVMKLTYGDSPMAEQVAPEWRDKICHATLRVHDSVLNGADTPAEQYQRPQGFFVLLAIDDLADATRVFNGLAENGTVHAPFQGTFWSAGFGVVVDRFGIPWEVSCARAPEGT